MLNKILQRVFKGLLTLTPIVIIVMIVNYVFNLIYSVIVYILGSFQDIYLSTFIIILMVILLYFLGIVYETKQKIFLLNFFDWLFEKIPFLNSVNKFVKDIMDLLFSDSKEKYLGVIEIEYGGYIQYGFITKELDNRYIVFIPTAPNPTNGFVVFLDKENPKYPYKFVDIEPKKAISTIVSLGLN